MGRRYFTVQLAILGLVCAQAGTLIAKLGDVEECLKDVTETKDDNLNITVLPPFVGDGFLAVEIYGRKPSPQCSAVLVSVILLKQSTVRRAENISRCICDNYTFFSINPRIKLDDQLEVKISAYQYTLKVHKTSRHGPTLNMEFYQLKLVKEEFYLVSGEKVEYQRPNKNGIAKGKTSSFQKVLNKELANSTNHTEFNHKRNENVKYDNNEEQTATNVDQYQVYRAKRQMPQYHELTNEKSRRFLESCAPKPETCPMCYLPLHQILNRICTYDIIMRVIVLHDGYKDNYGRVCGKIGIIKGLGQVNEDHFRRLIRFSVRENCNCEVLRKPSQYLYFFSSLSAWRKEGAFYTKISLSENVIIIQEDRYTQGEIQHALRYCKQIQPVYNTPLPPKPYITEQEYVPPQPPVYSSYAPPTSYTQSEQIYSITPKPHVTPAGDKRCILQDRSCPTCVAYDPNKVAEKYCSAEFAYVAVVEFYDTGYHTTGNAYGQFLCAKIRAKILHDVTKVQEVHNVNKEITLFLPEQCSCFTRRMGLDAQVILLLGHYDSHPGPTLQLTRFFTIFLLPSEANIILPSCSVSSPNIQPPYIPSITPSSVTYPPYIMPPDQPRYIPPPTNPPYAPPATQPPYLPPTTPYTPPVTQSLYTPPATYPPYIPPTTQFYVPVTYPSYIPPTTPLPYVPPKTLSPSYVLPSVKYSPYVPPTFSSPYTPPPETYPPYASPPVTYPPYVPPVTLPPYVPMATPPPYRPPATPPPYRPPATPPPYVPPATPPPYVPPATPPPYVPPATLPPYMPPATPPPYRPPATPPPYRPPATPPPYRPPATPPPYRPPATPPPYRPPATPPPYRPPATPPPYRPPATPPPYRPPATPPPYRPPATLPHYVPPTTPPPYRPSATPLPYMPPATPPPYRPPATVPPYVPPATPPPYVPPTAPTYMTPPVVYAKPPVVRNEKVTPSTSAQEALNCHNAEQHSCPVCVDQLDSNLHNLFCSSAFAVKALVRDIGSPYGVQDTLPAVWIENQMRYYERRTIINIKSRNTVSKCHQGSLTVLEDFKKVIKSTAYGEPYQTVIPYVILTVCNCPILNAYHSASRQKLLVFSLHPLQKFHDGSIQLTQNTYLVSLQSQVPFCPQKDQQYGTQTVTPEISGQYKEPLLPNIPPLGQCLTSDSSCPVCNNVMPLNFKSFYCKSELTTIITIGANYSETTQGVKDLKQPVLPWSYPKRPSIHIQSKESQKSEITVQVTATRTTLEKAQIDLPEQTCYRERVRAFYDVSKNSNPYQNVVDLDCFVPENCRCSVFNSGPGFAFVLGIKRPNLSGQVVPLQLNNQYAYFRIPEGSLDLPDCSITERDQQSEPLLYQQTLGVYGKQEPSSSEQSYNCPEGTQLTCPTCYQGFPTHILEQFCEMEFAVIVYKEEANVLPRYSPSLTVIKKTTLTQHSKLNILVQSLSSPPPRKIQNLPYRRSKRQAAYAPCPKHMVWDSCASSPDCEVTCENYQNRYDLVCPLTCHPRCICTDGLVRHGDFCLKPHECPARMDAPKCHQVKMKVVRDLRETDGYTVPEKLNGFILNYCECHFTDLSTGYAVLLSKKRPVITASGDLQLDGKIIIVCFPDGSTSLPQCSNTYVQPNTYTHMPDYAQPTYNYANPSITTFYPTEKSTSVYTPSEQTPPLLPHVEIDLCSQNDESCPRCIIEKVDYLQEYCNYHQGWIVVPEQTRPASSCKTGVFKALYKAVQKKFPFKEQKELAYSIPNHCRCETIASGFLMILMKKPHISRPNLIPLSANVDIYPLSKNVMFPNCEDFQMETYQARSRDFLEEQELLSDDTELEQHNAFAYNTTRCPDETFEFQQCPRCYSAYTDEIKNIICSSDEAFLVSSKGNDTSKHFIPSWQRISLFQPTSPKAYSFRIKIEDTNDNEACTLPLEVGQCNSPITRFYYNNKTKQCEEFQFSGCEGNRNNFLSKETCKNTCLEQPFCREGTLTVQKQLLMNEVDYEQGNGEISYFIQSQCQCVYLNNPTGFAIIAHNYTKINGNASLFMTEDVSVIHIKEGQEMDQLPCKKEETEEEITSSMSDTEENFADGEIRSNDEMMVDNDDDNDDDWW